MFYIWGGVQYACIAIKIKINLSNSQSQLTIGLQGSWLEGNFNLKLLLTVAFIVRKWKVVLNTKWSLRVIAGYLFDNLIPPIEFGGVLLFSAFFSEFFACGCCQLSCQAVHVSSVHTSDDSPSSICLKDTYFTFILMGFSKHNYILQGSSQT